MSESRTSFKCDCGREIRWGNSCVICQNRAFRPKGLSIQQKEEQKAKDIQRRINKTLCGLTKRRR